MQHATNNPQPARTERITTQVTEREKRAAEVVARALGVRVSNLLRERSVVDVVELYDRLMAKLREEAA